MDIIIPEMRQQYDVEGMMHVECGYDAIFSTEPIRTLDDLKDKKIRAFGHNSFVVLEYLGAVPVNVPFGEVYLGLQTGLLDAGFTGIVSGVGSNWTEPAKYILYGELGGAATLFYPVSGTAWRALPDDLKPKVKRVFEELQAEYDTEAVSWTERVLAEAGAQGAEVVYPTPEELVQIGPAVKTLVTEWRQRCETVGYKIPAAWEEYIRARGLWAD